MVPNANGKHVLIVEDEETYAKSTSERMTHEGYKVTVCYDGEAGLQSALADHPDIILLDLNLPKITGMNVINRLRHDPWGENVPVIILTNLNPSDELMTGVLMNQPSYYLLKDQTTLNDMAEKVKGILQQTPVEESSFS